MKTKITYSLLAAAAACSLANAETAYTTPVGYITHTINSVGGGEALTIIGPSLIQPSVFSGASTASPSGSTVTFSGGVPTGLDSTYVLEITSGAKEGWWSTVASSTATTVTTNDAFPGGLGSGTTVSVRKHNTLQTFFGENNPGLIAFDGGSGDEIQIFNSDQSLTAFSYVPSDVSGEATSDWYNLSTAQIANDQIIEPGAAVIIKTNSASQLSFISTGEVKLTNTEVDVFPGLTLIAQPLAVGGSFNSMDLQNQLIPLNAEASNVDFDEFQIFNADQSLTAYAAADPAIFGSATMVNLSSAEDAGAVSLAEGVGAIVKRNPSISASTIILPGTNIQ
jgi:uncharacterized protein (TIGR02597 family)